MWKCQALAGVRLLPEEPLLSPQSSTPGGRKGEGKEALAQVGCRGARGGGALSSCCSLACVPKAGPASGRVCAVAKVCAAGPDAMHAGLAFPGCSAVAGPRAA